jgi:hypothetical protein
MKLIVYLKAFKPVLLSLLDQDLIMMIVITITISLKLIASF